MTAEEKVLEKLRNVLIADSDINGYVEGRVYLDHPSTIGEPKYPAISFSMIQSAADVSVPTQSSIEIQIDIWLDSTGYSSQDLLILHRKIRSLLHRANLSDTTLDLLAQMTLESLVGPVMYEEDTKLLHLPLRYRVVAI